MPCVRLGMKVFFHFLLTIAIFTIVKKANADAVTLDWSPSVSAHVVRYAVYFGTTAGNYPFRVSAGDSTSITISNLTAGATYYFVATAYNASGMQSRYSAPLKVVIPAASSGASGGSGPSVPGAASEPVTRPTGNPLQRPIDGQVGSWQFTGVRSMAGLASAARGLGATERSQVRAVTMNSEAPASAESTAASIGPNSTTRTMVSEVVQTAQSEPESIMLAITQSADDPSTSLLQFPVTQGHWYEVQATTDLQSWDSIWQSSIEEADGMIQFADQDAKSYMARFYRVVSH